MDLPEVTCLRCFRKGHNYEICFYNTDIEGNILIKKGIEQMEYFNGKYLVNNFYHEKCPKCGERKHLNPKCHNSLFLYREDLD